jgi:deoxyribodipyrimidine photolyase-related protein
MLLIFPTQLFDVYDLLKLITVTLTHIIIIEEPRYFTDFNFHKLKLMYHRANMKKYCDYLLLYKNMKHIDIQYIDFSDVNINFYKTLNQFNKQIYYINPIDHVLSKKLKKLITKSIVFDSPNFLLTPKEVKDNKHEFKTKNGYRHDLFYKFQRKRLDVLMKGEYPIDNKWSFDSLNREAKITETKFKMVKVKKDKYYKEALKYVEYYFSENYGETTEWNFPIDHKTSLDWLKHFFKNKLEKFGKNQDSSIDGEPFLFHSAISPMLNIGLLTDKIVLYQFKKFISKHKISISSSEGFIRQVIGWRNYIYIYI